MTKEEFDVFKTVLVHLIAASSAYDKYVGGHDYRGSKDPFKSTRLADFDKAIELGRELWTNQEETDKPV